MITRKNQTQTAKIDFNLFSPEEYKELDLLLQTEILNGEEETRVNRDVWDERLFKNTQGKNLMTLIENEEFRDIVIDRIIERFNSTRDHSKYSILYYRTEGQFNLNWHNDGNHQGAVSIYLNDNWHRDLGGYLIYQMDDEDLMTAVQPKIGTAVYHNGGVLHGTTPVSEGAPSRKSIQVFINE